jgi:hypothetical protein
MKSTFASESQLFVATTQGQSQFVLQLMTTSVIARNPYNDRY